MEFQREDHIKSRCKGPNWERALKYQKLTYEVKAIYLYYFSESYIISKIVDKNTVTFFHILLKAKISFHIST